MQSATETCIADDKADTEEMRTYVIDASLTCAGRKAAASSVEAAMKAIVMVAPSMVWMRMRVYERPRREERVRVVLSPMMTQAAQGRPSLRTSAMTPM